MSIQITTAPYPVSGELTVSAFEDSVLVGQTYVKTQKEAEQWGKDLEAQRAKNAPRKVPPVVPTETE